MTSVAATRQATGYQEVCLWKKQAINNAWWEFPNPWATFSNRSKLKYTYTRFYTLFASISSSSSVGMYSYVARSMIPKYLAVLFKCQVILYTKNIYFHYKHFKTTTWKTEQFVVANNKLFSRTSAGLAG